MSQYFRAFNLHYRVLILSFGRPNGDTDNPYGVRIFLSFLLFVFSYSFPFLVVGS